MNTKYFEKIHLWGTVWNYAALAMMYFVPLALSVFYGAWPSLGIIGKTLVTLIPLYWTTAIIEVVTYVPMLGAGGTYLSFVTGNISNLKLPCGLNAMENAKVRPNTEEGEVISTIAIAVSSLTTTAIIAAGVLLFAPILPKITADGSVFKAAFNNVLPALFGALGAGYFIKHWKLAFAPIIVGVLVLIFAPETGVGILMFITIVASVLGAAVIHRDLLSKESLRGSPAPEEIAAENAVNDTDE
ncbi:MAG: hypothetical protein IJK60_07165 [Clostridia bacterium]|nr:hypothetical protein [Clostridia bacterium]